MEKNMLIAILRKVPDEKLERTVLAIAAGGIWTIEVTFDHTRQDHIAHEQAQIRALISCLGPDMMIGAGTVLTVEEVRAARDAGARIIISPDVNPDVIGETKRLGLISCPGALTPSEITLAHRCGADMVKVFPAGQLGPAYIRAVRGPLAHIPLIAVGGVNAENIADFLRADCAGAGLGGELVKKELIEKDDYAGLEALAANIVRAAELA